MSKIINDTQILVKDAILWGESPRWYKGELYVSDIMGKKVVKINKRGNLETVIDVPGMPSGTGFLPDGQLILVSGLDGKLYTREQEQLKEYADIYSSLPDTRGINDMVVNKNGDVYVGCYGYDITNYTGGEAAGWIAFVNSKKEIQKTAENIICPNGMVITEDGRTLIAADTIAKQLIAWKIQEDGILAERRIFAELEDGPDGIAVDQQGAVWAALPHLKQVVRVCEHGEITHRIPLENKPLACMLGGIYKKTLYIVTVRAEDINNPMSMDKKCSSVEYVENVEISGAGCP